MAVALNPALKYKKGSLLSQPLQFKRHREKVKTKKIQKRVKVKPIHIVFTFLLLAGIFFLIQQVYLFLMTWDHLDIKAIEVRSQKTGVQEDIQASLKGKDLGNILLLDIGHLQKILSSHRWVKHVFIRKIFPSSLRIEIQERTPEALLKKEDFYLIDRDGVLLEKIDPNHHPGMVLLVDSNNFEKDHQEKIELAWKCLESLAPPERGKIELLDLTDYGNVTAKLKGSEINLILGSDGFSEKLEFFQGWQSRLEKYQRLEYVDLRFGDRIYIKPQKHSTRQPVPNSDKEAR